MHLSWKMMKLVNNSSSSVHNNIWITGPGNFATSGLDICAVGLVQNLKLLIL